MRTTGIRGESDRRRLTFGIAMSLRRDILGSGSGDGDASCAVSVDSPRADTDPNWRLIAATGTSSSQRRSPRQLRRRWRLRGVGSQDRIDAARPFTSCWSAGVASRIHLMLALLQASVPFQRAPACRGVRGMPTRTQPAVAQLQRGQGLGCRLRLSAARGPTLSMLGRGESSCPPVDCVFCLC